ncbi:hypothetical protein [Parasitella parasitica]|uniref:Uncharacterized protein n=1 Tax=Parasitella parasitica TaxID=35722 RepID=A0A0B7N1W4_9FUNG|nr:hypothetical protein [Parasitella parasitica]
MGNIVSTPFFTRSIATSNSGMTDYFEDFDDDATNTESKHLLRKQLVNYMKHFTHQKERLSELEESFLLVLQSSIINLLGKEQCESYQKYGSFNGTDLKIMSSICRLTHFDADKYSEVSQLVEPLKTAFKTGSLQKVLVSIETMKNYNDQQGLPLSTIGYKLLDILEYM